MAHYSESTIERLSTIFSPDQLADLIAVCEKIRDSGDGRGIVAIQFQKNCVFEFTGSFTYRSPSEAYLRAKRYPE